MFPNFRSLPSSEVTSLSPSGVFECELPEYRMCFPLSELMTVVVCSSPVSATMMASLWSIHKPISVFNRCSLSLSAKPDALEIDEAALDIRVDQLHPHPVAHIQTLDSLHQLAFHGDAQQPDPGALLGGARNDGVKLLPDPRLEQQRGGRFLHTALHLRGF